jgi:hypothetical protein
MKKICILHLLIISFTLNSFAQTEAPIRKQGIGFSFIMNNFATANRIRTTSLATVIREKSFWKSESLAYGFGVNYTKGLTPHIDFAANLGATFSTEVYLDNLNREGDLIELDASGHFKMFTDKAVFNPYLIGGIGASKFRNVFGAFVPLGGGLNVRLFDEARLFTEIHYRVPVTTEANNYHFQLSFGVSGVF